MRYIQGHSRDQITFFPASLDEYVSEDNPVRVIDAFVASLELQEMGFSHSSPKVQGRTPYNPADILKLYIYGYLNRIRSSRRLEEETHRNIELMWLMQMLRPDFKTIADFRKDNRKALKGVFRRFSMLCRKLDLFGLQLFGIDGSKFAAVNHTSKVYSKNKLEQLIKDIDARIDDYLSTLEQSDHAEKDIPSNQSKQIQQYLKELKEKRQLCLTMQQTLEESGEPQIALTDPESRLMRDGHNGRDVCYNVQMAVDQKHKLIADFDVTNDLNDLQQLIPMATKIKQSFDLERIDATADAGYFSKDAIKKGADNQMFCYVPEPLKSKNHEKGMYTNKDFKYDKPTDTYLCPAGQTLCKTSCCVNHNRKEFIYKTRACRSCSQKIKCTTSREGRRILRWEHEDVIENMNNTLINNNLVAVRREICEHPFGTIKQTMGYRSFLCKGIAMATAEMSLTALAYNIKRAINILSAAKLREALA
jgi:transposase